MSTTIAPNTRRTPSLASRLAHRVATTVSKPACQALANPLVQSIVRLDAVEDALSAIHPLLSISEIRARVVRIDQETSDTKTFVLQPNALWLGARAGQFVRVRLEIDGRRVERMYSLSSRPNARRLAITVKRQAGGQMSTHLHHHTQVGDVLTISQAMGEFILPSIAPTGLLLLSAGSGITPAMAMLRDLHASSAQAEVVFLHVCRSAQDLIFGAALQQIARDMPTLRLIVHTTENMGRFDAKALQRAVPNLGEHDAYLCGPSAMMDWVHAMWTERGFTAVLSSERFTASPLAPTVDGGQPVTVKFTRSAKSFITQGNLPLLMQAEAAGLSPKHGCRIGICRSCQCIKTSGTVQNIQTGELSSAPNELIRICVSAARSEVQLEL